VNVYDWERKCTEYMDMKFFTSTETSATSCIMYCQWWTKCSNSTSMTHKTQMPIVHNNYTAIHSMQSNQMALGLTYPMGTGRSFPGTEQLGCVANQWLLPSAMVKNMYSYTSTPAPSLDLRLHGMHRESFIPYIQFTLEYWSFMTELWNFCSDIFNIKYWIFRSQYFVVYLFQIHKN
jgi:hypothetical protein